MTRKQQIFSCCYQCKESFEGCHGVCVTFLKAQNEWKEYKEMVNKARQERLIYEKYHFDRIKQQRIKSANKKRR